MDHSLDPKQHRRDVAEQSCVFEGRFPLPVLFVGCAHGVQRHRKPVRFVELESRAAKTGVALDIKPPWACTKSSTGQKRETAHSSVLLHILFEHRNWQRFIASRFREFQSSVP